MDKNLALEALKSFVENTDDVIVKDAILALHPELKESEDERMMAWLITQLKTNYKGNYWASKAIEYLEKQKEQKPAEYEKPLLSKFEQAVYDCAWGKVTCKPEGETKEEYAKRWAEQFLSMVRDWADDYIDSQIESAKRKAYDRGKADAEKPVEWSEEDENYLEEIIDDLKFCKKNRRSCVNGLIEDCIDWLNNRLKSIRPQPHWKPSEQEKGALRTAIYILTEERNFPKAAAQLQSILNAFEGKESRKDWKPSEEQMIALKKAICYLAEYGSRSDDDLVLDTLYDELKKL